MKQSAGTAVEWIRHSLFDWQTPVKLASLFLAASAIGVLATDAVVHTMGIDLGLLFPLQTVPLWAFVAAATILPFLFHHRFQRRLKHVTSSLLESEHHYRLLMDQAPDAIIVVDGDGKLIDVNSSACETTGYHREELLRMHARDLLAEPFNATPVIQRLREGKAVLGEQQLRCKDGSTKSCEVHARLRENETILAIVRDSTARNRTTEALQHVTDDLRLVLTSVPDYFWVAEVDASKRFAFTYYSPVVERITGRPPSYFIDMQDGWLDIVAPDDRPRVKGFAENLIRGVATHAETEYRILRTDGTTRWVRDSVNVTRLDGGRLRLSGIVSDITERKEIQVALEHSIQTLETIVQASPVAIIVTDTDGIVWLWNRSAESMFGWQAEEVVNKPNPIIPPDKQEEVQLIRQRILNGESLSNVETSRAKKDGSRISVSFSTAVLHDPHGNVQGLMAMFSDISEQKRALTSLRESEEKFAKAFRSSPDSIAISTLDEGRYIEVNDGFQRIFGHTRDEALGRTAADLNLWTDPSDRHRLVRMIETDGSVRNEEFTFRTKCGETRTGLVSAEIMDIGGKQCLLALTRDITERKKAEQSLYESEERYRRFFEEDLTGDYISTVEGTLLSCNPAFLRIFGFSSMEEALACNTFDLYPSRTIRNEVIDLLRKLRKLEYHESELRRRDGKPVFVVENIVGVFDPDGNLTGLKGYLFDNTHLKRLEEHVRQAQKIESLGTLAGGIAHDFNNLLGIIAGHAALLKHEQQLPQQVTRTVEAITTATQRGTGLVKQLLTFAHKTDVQFVSVDLNSIIEELIPLLRETFPKTITLTQELDPRMPHITGDSNQIHQALLNMCINARDAMPEGGVLKLKTFVIDRDDLREPVEGPRVPSYAAITVADSGTGMDTETQQRIFEPFFTTKDRGRGSGLGLSVVYGIVKTHHGFINVSSRPGQGTTFSTYFPLPLDVVKTREKPVVERFEEPGGTETILVAEDEPLLMELVKTLLDNKGYTLFQATDGEQLLNLYGAHHGRINLVLSDLGLPKLSGWEACQRILRQDPQAKIMIASGFIDPLARQEMTRGGVREFIEKPYSSRDILSKIRTVLDTLS